MNTSFSSSAPARLYALLLKLRPMQVGTLMAFNGELVHGAWMHWLGRAAPDVAEWLHEGNRRRLFTCSSLQFPVPEQRMLEAEQHNVHLPVLPEKVYTLRITLLLGELFPLFHEALMRFHIATNDGERQPFMQIGKQVFALEEVVLKPDDAGWTGFTSLGTLVEQARMLRMGKDEPMKLEFATLTTFNRSSSKSKRYGAHSARLPLTEYVFPGLARRWEDVASPELAGVVQRERIEQYVEDDGVIIADYELRTHTVKFTTHTQPGFVGKCTYALRGPDEMVTEEAPLTVRQQLWLLGQLAFYSGVGYKTTMGLGRVRIA